MSENWNLDSEIIEILENLPDTQAELKAILARLPDSREAVAEAERAWQREIARMSPEIFASSKPVEAR